MYIDIYLCKQNFETSEKLKFGDRRFMFSYLNACYIEFGVVYQRGFKPANKTDNIF